MTSRNYGLPASVVLFGTIYAIALGVAPGKSSAALQSERAHTPLGLVAPETRILSAEATRAGPKNLTPQQSKPGGS